MLIILGASKIEITFTCKKLICHVVVLFQSRHRAIEQWQAKFLTVLTSTDEDKEGNILLAFALHLAGKSCWKQ